MTDAREIIARHLCVMAAQTWSGISPFERAAYRTTAHGMIEAINAAGIRILGPDEVDQVTVEKCAEVAEERAEWVPLKAGDMRAAILALATKEEGDE